MRMTFALWLLLVAASPTASAFGPGLSAHAADPSQLAPVKGIACGKGSYPQKAQGHAPLSDVATDRTVVGSTCNFWLFRHRGRFRE